MTYSKYSEVNNFLDEWLDEYLMFVKCYLYTMSTDEDYFYTLSKEYFDNWEFYHSRDYSYKTLLVRNVKIRNFSSLLDVVRDDLIANFGESEVSEMSESEMEAYLWSYINEISEDTYGDLNSISEQKLGESLVVVGRSGGYWGYDLLDNDFEYRNKETVDAFFELSASMKKASIDYLVSELEKNIDLYDVDGVAWTFVESIFSDKSITDDSLVPSDGFKEVITYLDSLMAEYK